jgi:hypothetical protein
LPAKFEFNTGKLVARFALPIGALVIYVAYTCVTAWSHVAVIPDEARRHAAIHGLTAMTAIALACLVAVLVAVFLVVRNAGSTEFGESELSRPGLFRRTRLQWSEITEVKRYRNGAIRLKGGHDGLLIPVGYYREPHLVTAYVTERLKALSRARE